MACGAARTLEFTCIVCPLGCRLRVLLEEGGIASVEGNRCSRGVVYAQNEVDPKRTLITVVEVLGGDLPVVSVKTSKPIPKNLIPAAMRFLSKLVVKAPVKVGDVLVEDLLGLGVDVVATRKVETV